jgi:hypothetical protein
MSTDAKELGWCILELMGHRKMGGYVREQEVAGAGFLRIDVPSQCSGISDKHCPVCGDCQCPDPETSLNDPNCPLHAPDCKHGEPIATQLYSPSAVYCITPVGEAEARAVAARCQPEPVARWEMQRQIEPARPAYARDDDDEDHQAPEPDEEDEF